MNALNTKAWVFKVIPISPIMDLIELWQENSSNINGSSRQFSFLNSSNKLVFVRLYGSTFIGLVEPPYPYCSLIAFCAFLCFIARKKHSKAKIN